MRGRTAMLGGDPREPVATTMGEVAKALAVGHASGASDVPVGSVGIKARTCRNMGTRFMFACSECGERVPTDTVPTFKLRYCPACGAEIEG